MWQSYVYLESAFYVGTNRIHWINFNACIAEYYFCTCPLRPAVESKTETPISLDQIDTLASCSFCWHENNHALQAKIHYGKISWFNMPSTWQLNNKSILLLLMFPAQRIMEEVECSFCIGILWKAFHFKREYGPMSLKKMLPCCCFFKFCYALRKPVTKQHKSEDLLDNNCYRSNCGCCVKLCVLRPRTETKRIWVYSFFAGQYPTSSRWLLFLRYIVGIT